MSYLSDLLGEAYKEGMSEDDISKAIEGVVTGKDSEIEKLRKSVSKANTEAAEFKNKLRDKLSDDEKKKTEEAEKLDKIIKENEELKRSISISEKKSKLIGMGYDEKMADETATAMIDGNLDKVLENQSKYLETQKKVIETDLLKKTPRPNGGNGGDGDNGLDYGKMINEALDRGDMTAAAYYTRLKGQAENSE